MRRLLIFVILYLFVTPAFSNAEEFLERQLNSGIRNSEEYSYLLIRQAHADRAEATALLKRALTYSPDLPAVYFELSKNSFSLSAIGILDSIDYIVLGINAYFRNFWWSLTLAGSLLTSLIFSFLLAIALIIAIRLFGDISLIAHDIKENSGKSFFFLFLLLLSIISPFLLLAGLLVLLGLYMKKIDRVVVYLFLFFIIISPLIFRTASVFLTAYSGDIKSIVQSNESKGNDYALSVLKNNNEYTALFTSALSLKRKGYYEEAINIYKSLIEHKPDPKAYINLANCYVGLYNSEEARRPALEEAYKYYLMSIKIKPLASAYYNLSQISREMLDFKKGNEYFKSALELDRNAVTEYRTIYGRNPNRLVIDETLGFTELWEYVIKKTKNTTRFGMTIVPPFLLPPISLALMIFFYSSGSRIKHKAYRCRRCNAILCTRCEKSLIWGQMCPMCYRSLIKLDELDSKERIARLLSIYAHQKKRRDTMKILSFILPGSAQIFAGKILYGLVLMWPFLFFILLPFIISIFTADSLLLSHAFFKWTAILSAAVLYFASNLITRQRISKGWL
ncbi:MAG: hypothetical protein AB1632_10010 [Nitrospirota bacterium]